MELKKEGRVKLKPADLGGGLDLDQGSSSTKDAALGNFFLCRTSTVPKKQGSSSSIVVNVMVSDPEGIGKLSLTLINYFSGGGCLEDVLPVGSYLAIKNPKNPKDSKSKLICDNPGEVVILSKKDVRGLMGQDFVWTPSLGFWDQPSPPSKKSKNPGNPNDETQNEEDNHFFKPLKNLGNKLFLSNCFVHAIRTYDLVLQYAPTDQERSKVISSKAQAFLALGCYAAAVEAAKTAADLDPSNVKAVVRLGEALVGLGDFEGAAKEVKSRMTTDNQQMSLKLKRCLEKIENHLSRASTPLSSKEYDSLLETIAKVDLIAKRTEVLDFYPLKTLTDGLTEFHGKGTVQVKETEGIMGRGLFATRDIAPGEVVLMTRALAFKTRPDGWNNAMAEVSGGVSSPHLASLKEDLVSQVANKVSLDAGVGAQVYQLYAGEELEPLEDTGLVDLARIKGIVSHNATTFWHPGPAYVMDGNLGLWTLPSFINHSCSGRNVEFQYFGEFLLVKALEEIKEGEEILRSYVPGHWPYEKKQDILNKAYGFTCTCPLCSFALTEKDSAKGRRWVKIAALWMTLPNLNFIVVLSSRNPEQLLADMAFMEGLWRGEAPFPGLFRHNGLQNLASFFMMVGREEDAYRVSRFALLSAAAHGTERLDSIKLVITSLLRLGRVMGPGTRRMTALEEELVLWYGSIQTIRKVDPGFVAMLMARGIDFLSSIKKKKNARQRKTREGRESSWEEIFSFLALISVFILIVYLFQ